MLLLTLLITFLPLTNLLAQGNSNCTPGKACSYTPGFYGGSGNSQTCDGQSTIDIMNYYLDDGDMVVGRGTKILTLTAGDANCILDIMPAGGTPDAILSGPNTCNSITGIPLQNSGKLNNVLVGQVIALSFNVRVSPELGIVPVVDSLVIQDINCIGNNTGPE